MKQEPTAPDTFFSPPEPSGKEPTMLPQSSRITCGAMLAVAVFLVGQGRPADAGVKTWDGSTDVSWFTTAAWDPAGVPLATDNVVINSGRPISSSLDKINVSGGGSITLSGSTAQLGKKQSPSSWQAPQLYVGKTGSGQVLVTGGADLVTMATELGCTSGAIGEVTLQGTGTTWSVGVGRKRCQEPFPEGQSEDRTRNNGS